jgi:hypothetical protein
VVIVILQKDRHIAEHAFLVIENINPETPIQNVYVFLLFFRIHWDVIDQISPIRV